MSWLAFLAGAFVGATIGFVAAALCAAAAREDEAIERAITQWSKELNL